VDIKEKSAASTELGNQQPNSNIQRENQPDNQRDNQATLSVQPVQPVQPGQPPPPRRASTIGSAQPSNDMTNEPLVTAANGHQSTPTEQNSSDRPDVQMTDEPENGDSAPSYNMRLRRSTNNQEQNYNLYDPSNVAPIEAQAQISSGPPSRESAYVSMIAWNLDDTACIIATTYGDIKVFDSETGELLGTLVGHTEETYAVDVHPTDNRTILSAGYDGRAILWDLATFTQISCHYYPERNLLDCKFSRDGKVYQHQLLLLLESYTDI
jgi:WD40 repeat protein